MFPADFAERVRLDIRMILEDAVLDGLILSNPKPSVFCEICVNLRETSLREIICVKSVRNNPYP
ncbi:MAG TPA: hypothetical protein DCF33_13845 [Saprospirales bacterium]|nr:hypothetical protein [Saprospirales bacterium]